MTCACFLLSWGSVTIIFLSYSSWIMYGVIRSCISCARSIRCGGLWVWDSITCTKVLACLTLLALDSIIKLLYIHLTRPPVIAFLIYLYFLCHSLFHSSLHFSPLQFFHSYILLLLPIISLDEHNEFPIWSILAISQFLSLLLMITGTSFFASALTCSSFVDHELSTRLPLLLSPVGLNNFIALWFPVAETLILPLHTCADLWLPGPHWSGPLPFRLVLTWIFTLWACACSSLSFCGLCLQECAPFRSALVQTFFHPVCGCGILILLVHNIITPVVPWASA